MSFSTGLSGLAAANKDLKVTGNNIANASTTGFKASRTEFGDAYTSSMLGTGRNPVGGGVNIANIGQKMTQGNITQTGSVLDMAIDGSGFFVTQYPNGEVTYTRSGIFGVDKNGYITSNQNARLQGFGASASGIVDGILQDLRIDTASQPPRGTNKVNAGVNVPAGAPILAQLGSITRTNGLAIGQVQVGSPVATQTVLSTVGVPTTAGTASSVTGSLNLADIYTAGDAVEPVGIYSTGISTPQFYSLNPDAAMADPLAPLVGASDTIDLSIQLPGSAVPTVVTLGPLTAQPTTPAQARTLIETALNSNPITAGRVFVHLDTLPDQLRFFSTNGTEFQGIVGGTGNLIDAIGYGGVGGAASGPELLFEPLPNAQDIEINFQDSGVPTTITATFAAGTQYTDQATLINDLNNGVGSVTLSGPLPAGLEFQLTPNGNGIELISTDPDIRITNIQDVGPGTSGTQLGLTGGAVSERVFQNVPSPTDTIQIQIQDPLLNGGAPLAVSIAPFPGSANFATFGAMLDAFQTSIDDNSILGGRIIVQADPEQLPDNVVQFVSTSGTRVLSVNDIGGSNIAEDLFLRTGDGASAAPSVFSQLPPASPQTLDITLQGPNINDGISTTITLEPFPIGGQIRSMSDLIESFQAAVNNDSTLAGRVRVQEDPDRPGYLQVTTDGPFASDGTSIVRITDNVGTLTGLLGIDTEDVGPNAPLVTAPIAGSDLFAGGGSIDLTTIPGTPVQVQGNNTTQLTFNNFESGTVSTLRGSLSLPSTSIGDQGGVLGRTLDIRVLTGSIDSTISIPVPGTGFASRADLANAVNNALFANPTLSGNVTAGLDGTNLLFANTANNSNPITVVDNGSTAVGFNADTLGLTSNSVPLPTSTPGTSDTPANNQLRVSVGGENPGVGTIVIPAGEYTNADEVVASINAQINAVGQLAGKVEASQVNGRIVFALTALGGFPNSLNVTNVPGNTGSLAAIGHSSQTTTAAIDPVDRRNSFRINLAVPLPDPDNRSGSVEISIDENIRSIEQLAQAINRELADVPEADYIGVKAQVTLNPDGTKQLQLVATRAGEPSQISISNVQAIGEDITVEELNAMLQIDRLNSDYLELGQPKVNNGYPEQSFILTDPDGEERIVTIDEKQTASQTATQLSALPGVNATASTQLRFLSSDYSNAGDMNVFINGQVITSNNFLAMVEEINQYQQTSLSGITASLDGDSGDLILTSGTGQDITVQIESPRVADRLTLLGEEGTAPITLGAVPDGETTALVGGTVEIILNKDYSMRQPDPRVTGLFNGLVADDFEDFVINAFDPKNPETYNETSSLTIYDSLGNQHVLQMFFVKDQDDPNRPFDLNSWTVYAQIDGRDIGDPDLSLPFPENQVPTQAQFKMFFNADGTLNKEASGSWLISNWLPRNDEGGATGGYGPRPQAQGGQLPIPVPNVSSNFEINFERVTQFGGPFSRENFSQDGYASGQLKDLEINDQGEIAARYTNGQSQVIGQVAVASFRNPEGLSPIGFTEWTESFESGDATIGVPGTGTLGKIRSSALEDSNVDLSEQLVHLIIAQRNFQASAKTIETASAITQTIINLR
ncbi:flagellar hook-basal body complex protein [Salinispirillum sp. LH 10-3-1]|uniref:Flagellar hook protein FlgE n=1 Tax=Salinispirillum sp. LH 10-3-1 TaxID=2952525 RepID=A0AB38YCE5_9GAMM